MNLLRPRTIVKSHVRGQVSQLRSLLGALRVYWRAFCNPGRRTWDIDGVDRQVSRVWNLRRRLQDAREPMNRVSRRGVVFPIFVDSTNVYTCMKTTSLGEEYTLARPGVTTQAIRLKLLRGQGLSALAWALLALVKDAKEARA